MKKILLETPYAGRPPTTSCPWWVSAPLAWWDHTLNVLYARAAMGLLLREGHAPFASHLLYTQVLDDKDPAEREQGILAGLALGDACDETHVFIDRGISRGMRQGVARATAAGRPVVLRSLLEPSWRYPDGA